MPEKKKIYLFYLSLRGNKNVPAWVVYSAMVFVGLAFILMRVFHSPTGLFVFLGFPLMLWTLKQSIEIDTENKLYRYGVDFAGFSFGKWQKLPEIQYVSVFNAQYRSYVDYDRDTGDYDINYRTEVNLIHGKNKKMTVWIGMSRKHAFNTANYFAENLELRVLNATQRPFVWLNEEQ